MNYWLVKSEPNSYSWNDLVKEKVSSWTGVRNYAARLNLQAMKTGDLVFFYHSNEGKNIVGIAKVVKENYPDPTTKDERWITVDLKPVRNLNRSISLDEIKTIKELSNMELLRLSRLSVQKVTEKEFNKILEMSETVI